MTLIALSENRKSHDWRDYYSEIPSCTLYYMKMSKNLQSRDKLRFFPFIKWWIQTDSVKMLIKASIINFVARLEPKTFKLLLY